MFSHDICFIFYKQPYFLFGEVVQSLISKTSDVAIMAFENSIAGSIIPNYAHIDDQDPEAFIEYSTVIYLNDDFEGGKLYFPKFGFTYVPQKLAGVFFISDGEKSNTIQLISGQNKAEIVGTSLSAFIYFNTHDNFELVE